MTEEEMVRSAASDLLGDVDGYKLRKGALLFIDELKARISSFRSVASKELFLIEAFKQLSSSVDRHRKRCSKGLSCLAEQRMQEVQAFLQQEIDNFKVPKMESTPNNGNISTPEINPSSTLKKIFISHASIDKDITIELVELLELIGIQSNQIFYSSHPFYGIAPGEDFLARIKSEIDADAMILFALSSEFFASPVCLCEMGAAWVLSKTHIPIVIPPFRFSDIKGVIPLTQGVIINDQMQINSFAKKITDSFNLKPVAQIDNWEGKRNRIITRIDNIINSK